MCHFSTLLFAATGKNDYSDDVQSIQKTYELFDTQTGIHVQLGHCIHTQAECRICVSCDTFRCSRSLDTVCEVVIKLHNALCIIEAEHVINSEVGYL